MQWNGNGFIYVLILIRLPLILAVAMLGFLLTEQLTSCDDCKFGVAEHNEWCHMVIVPRSIGGQKLEYTAFERNDVASISISGSGANMTRDTTLGTRLESGNCQLVLEDAPDNSWIVTDASANNISAQLILLEIDGLKPMPTPQCKNMGTDVPKDRRAFKTENLRSDLMILSPLVWLFLKVCGWYVEKSKMEADSSEDSQDAGWLKNLVSFTSYVIFMLAPNQILLPLTTIMLHETCPQLLTMSYESSVWTGALAYEFLVVAISAVYFCGGVCLLIYGEVIMKRFEDDTDSGSMTGFSSGGGCFMCGMCLLLYGGCLAMLVGGVYFVGVYVVKFAINVDFAVILGIDLRYLMTFYWPEVSIALEASLLRIFLFVVLLLDFITYVIKKSKMVTE